MMYLFAAAPEPAKELVAEAQKIIPERWSWLHEKTIGGNELWRIIAFCLSVLVSYLLARLLRSMLTMAATRLEAARKLVLAKCLQSLAKSSVGVLLAFGLQAGMAFLYLPEIVSDMVSSVALSIALAFLAYCLVEVVDAWLLQVAEATPSHMRDMLAPLVGASLRMTIVLLAAVQIMTILSAKSVASVVAGLGVGGLAIGLAAQDTIKNVFGSIMLFGDRPFELGDEIIVDSLRGNVERVGLRSTQFRTGDGYLITMPNGDLANKAIVNVSRRRTIARNLTLPLSYDLSPEQAERAVAIVKEILADRKELPPLAPALVYLSDLTSTALTLSINYQVMPPIWAQYVAFNEWVNLEILRRFQAEDIRLAHPTQTIELRGGDKNASDNSVGDKKSENLPATD
jgi:MscS family membrane protein